MIFIFYALDKFFNSKLGENANVAFEKFLKIVLYSCILSLILLSPKD